MGAMASQTTSLTIVYSTVYSGTDERKHQNSAPLASVREIHRWPVKSPFHEISASWRCLEFQPITGAAALQCGTVCCYRRQAAGDLKEMHWKVVAENEVVDVRSVFTRVNLTVGTIQKVVTEVQIRKMFTDLEVIRLYWPCHLFVSPACTA